VSRCAFLAFAAALALPLAAPLRASAVTFSVASSDSTAPSGLDAVLDIEVTGSTLTLTLTNTSASFNLNELFFNAASNVTGLSLTSATHSDGNADVTSDWSLVADGGPGNPTRVGGFGTFDFGLDGPVGQTDPALIGPGESIIFVLAISGTGPFSPVSFQELTSGPIPSLAAVKFVNGPGDDSAFGNAVPEPSTDLFVATGLAALGALRRRLGSPRA
jgi:hypothetical protein